MSESGRSQRDDAGRAQERVQVTRIAKDPISPAQVTSRLQKASANTVFSASTTGDPHRAALAGDSAKTALIGALGGCRAIKALPAKLSLSTPSPPATIDATMLDDDEATTRAPTAGAWDIEGLLAEAARLRPLLPPLFTWDELRDIINSWCVDSFPLDLGRC